MYTLSFTHSHPKNIFFRNAISEGAPQTIREDRESQENPLDTATIEAFRDLFRNKNFATKVEDQIKGLPNTEDQGRLLNALYGILANNASVDRIRQSTQDNLHSLMAQVKPNQDSIAT